MPKPITPRCNTARPAWAPARMCAPSCSTSPWERQSLMCLIAAPAWRCRIDFIAEQVASALPQIEGGNVKAIATLGAERAPGLENLPTAAELGVDGLNCGSWNALAVPKGTPEAIVRKLAQASSDAIDTPSVIERFK